jgi:hypothetical protein
LREALARSRAAMASRDEPMRATDANGDETASANGPGSLSEAQRDSIRARIRRGEMTQEEMRRLRSQYGAGAAGGAGGSGAARAGGRRALARDLVVFVMREGQPTPVAVQVGLTDWDYSEVIAGLQVGDSVALLPSAGLLRDQSELLERFQRFRQGVPGMRQTS